MARWDALERRLDDAAPLLRALLDDESANRRRVWAMREDAGYEAAFTEPEPLVTISVPTRERAALLMERSLPSILGQSYERLDVIVVGDDATPELAAAMRSVTDPRVRFVNLATRVRGPEGRHWLAAATMPRNEAYRLAQGRWTLDFDDDDALRPDAVAVLLEHARESRAEFVYGDAEQHEPDGTAAILGGFPPELGRMSLAAALVHGGLRVFTREHFAASLGLPGDWYRIERMLRAGVRFAYRPGVIHDYWPSTLWG
jgi:glycosyltransferase involved in cell wall biosynthesis